jgi:hypothetical protein
MATNSTRGGSTLPETISGKDVHSLGPSDNSDSGSDAVGAYGDDELASDSDAVGTGERAAVGTGREQPNADTLLDQIEQLRGAAADDALDDAAVAERAQDFDDLNEDAPQADGDDEGDKKAGARGKG